MGVRPLVDALAVWGQRRTRRQFADDEVDLGLLLRSRVGDQRVDDAVPSRFEAERRLDPAFEDPVSGGPPEERAAARMMSVLLASPFSVTAAPRP